MGFEASYPLVDLQLTAVPPSNTRKGLLGKTIALTFFLENLLRHIGSAGEFSLFLLF